MGGISPRGVEIKHELGRQLNFAAKAARTHLDRRLTASGSSFVIWTVLFALRAKGPLIQRELAEILNLEGPTLTRHLARMENEGLIARRKTTTDRRAAVVDVTEYGANVYAQLADTVRDSGEVVLAGFAEEEIEQFIGYLSRIIDNVAASDPAQRNVTSHP